MNAFGTGYAEFYDAFYHDKDYGAECNFLEKIFQKYSIHKINTILDLGCGTGGHSIELAKRGYKIAGIDTSEAMIDVARNKSKGFKNINAEFYVSRMEDINLERRFDAVICMFNAINHVTSDHGLERTLSNVHEHLSENGLFIFDFRNGITSLRSYSPVRTKWVNHEDKRILRISETELDAMEHLYHTTYSCLTFNDRQIIQEFYDKHIVRYMFPREVRYFLQKNQFEIVFMSRFLKLEVPADENEWNIVVIAKIIA